MRKLLTLTTAALLAAAVATSALAGTAPVKHAQVNDDGYSFAPRPLVIKKGTKVVWKWVNGTDVLHDVAVAKGPVKFKSPLKSTGTFSHLFNRRGTYYLHCTLHPYMKQKVVVK